jgi:hypothetical protein
MHADGENVETLIGEALARFALGLGRLQLLEDATGSISDFTYVLAHVCIDGPAGGTSLAKFSIPLWRCWVGREKVLRFNTVVTEAELRVGAELGNSNAPQMNADEH